MARKKSQGIEAVNLKPLIRQISKEKDLEIDVIKASIEEAIRTAAIKRSQSFFNPRPALDVDTGDLRIFVMKKVVVSVSNPRQEIDILKAKQINPSYMLNQEIEVEIDPEEFGRIAAQSVRQGILQRLRDAERERIYHEFKDKVGQVVTGIVQRYERRDAILSLGKVEMLLSWQEIPTGTRYKYGDRLRCLIIDVRKSPKGPQIILSRNRADLVKQLFAQEVPEIADGTVRILEVAREPGVRTKIAVSSMNSEVDPVGACVGMKGSRVQMIVRELENEKIDIVPYSSIPQNFIAAALNPAKIVTIRLNETERRAEAVVERETLSIAIGKRGQNAKLAAKLTGWKIDVIPQEPAELRQMQDEIGRRYLEDFLSQIEGLTGLARDALIRTDNFNSVEKLANSEPKALLNFTGDDMELAQDIVNGALEFLDELKEMQHTQPPSGPAETDTPEADTATPQPKTDIPDTVPPPES
jgi:N utilization substance protein A